MSKPPPPFSDRNGPRYERAWQAAEDCIRAAMARQAMSATEKGKQQLGGKLGRLLG